jgi:hypothetical protein
MADLILLGVPDGFPCYLAALSALPVAHQTGHERIKVEKAGHTCAFARAALDTYAREERAGRHPPVPLSLLGGVRRQVEEFDNQFEERRKVWTGRS